MQSSFFAALGWFISLFGYVFRKWFWTTDFKEKEKKKKNKCKIHKNVFFPLYKLKTIKFEKSSFSFWELIKKLLFWVIVFKKLNIKTCLNYKLFLFFKNQINDNCYLWTIPNKPSASLSVVGILLERENWCICVIELILILYERIHYSHGPVRIELQGPCDSWRRRPVNCVYCIGVKCEVVYLPGLGPKGPSLGQVPAQKKKKCVDCELRPTKQIWRISE